MLRKIIGVAMAFLLAATAMPHMSLAADSPNEYVAPVEFDSGFEAEFQGILPASSGTPHLIPNYGGVIMQTYGNFETAGVNIRVDYLDRATTTGYLHYRRLGDTAWIEGHPFVIYDNMHMATSLFHLEMGTTYELRVIIRDGGVVTDVQYGQVTTREEFSVPQGTRIVEVHNQEQFAAALAAIQPGDELRLAPGEYNGFTLNNAQGTAANPIIITSLTGEMPTIRGQTRIQNSRHVTLHNLHMTNMGRTSANLLIFEGDSQYINLSGSFLHDSGDSTTRLLWIFGSPNVSFSNFTIINNVFADIEHIQGLPWNAPSPDRSYYGIRIDQANATSHGRQLGGITIRNNTFFGMYDGLHTGGRGRLHPTYLCLVNRIYDTNDFLGTWGIQEMDVFDNVIFNVDDDGIQADGHHVNARFFRNTLGNVHTGISVAQSFPGPMFFVENTVHTLDTQAVKFNTFVIEDPSVHIMTHNVFFFHNTFVQYGPGRGDPTSGPRRSAIYWLDGRVGDVVQKNNIFVSRERAVTADVNAAWAFFDNIVMDYNLYWIWQENPPVVARLMPGIDGGGAHVNVGTWAEYVSQNIRGNDQNSIFANPMLDTSLDPRFRYDAGIQMLTLAAGSPAINAGTFIPGISRYYTPNIGADQAHNARINPPAPEEPGAVGAASFNVTFNAGRGSGNVPAAQSFDNGDTVTIPASPLPTRPHFDFIGWSRNPDQLTGPDHPGWEADVYEVGDTFVISGHTSFYAVWAPSTTYLTNLVINGVVPDYLGTPGGYPYGLANSLHGSITFTTSEAANIAWRGDFTVNSPYGIWEVNKATLHRPGLVIGGNTNHGTFPPHMNAVNWALTWTTHTVIDGDIIAIRLAAPPHGNIIYYTLAVTVVPDVVQTPPPGYFRVLYHANGTAVTVPVDTTDYEVGDAVSVAMPGNPDLGGTWFEGWALAPNAAHPTFTRAGANSFTVAASMADSDGFINLYAIAVPTNQATTFSPNSTIAGVAVDVGAGVAGGVNNVIRRGSVTLTETQATNAHVNLIAEGGAGVGIRRFLSTTTPNDANFWNDTLAPALPNQSSQTLLDGEVLGIRVRAASHPSPERDTWYLIEINVIPDASGGGITVQFDDNGTGLTMPANITGLAATDTVNLTFINTAAPEWFIGWSTDSSAVHPEFKAAGFTGFTVSDMTAANDVITLYAITATGNNHVQIINPATAFIGSAPVNVGVGSSSFAAVATNPGNVTVTANRADGAFVLTQGFTAMAGFNAVNIRFARNANSTGDFWINAGYAGLGQAMWNGDRLGIRINHGGGQYTFFQVNITVLPYVSGLSESVADDVLIIGDETTIPEAIEPEDIKADEPSQGYDPEPSVD